jgi:hypothetical protein
MERTKISSALAAIRRNRHDLARIGLQTAVATAATYVAAIWLGSPHVSWAVIAALFTIGVSADASYYNARGRIIGAFLGVALGLAAGWAAPAAVLAGLVAAVVVANMLATLWPSIRYAAVTAAIVALEPTPSLIKALSVVAAILLGTLIAAATSFALWPSFGRRRVAFALREAVTDCRDLLKTISGRADTADGSGTDTLHARFLGHLEACHDRIASTRFEPRLPSGASLRDAATAIESLWHSIVILDRAMADEYEAIGAATLRDLAPAIGKVERCCEAELTAIASALEGRDDDLGNARVREAMSEAIGSVERLLGRAGSDRDQAHGLHALMFALAEIERRLDQLGDVVRGAAGPQGAGTAAPSSAAQAPAPR